MIKLTLSEALKAMGARMPGDVPEGSIAGVSTDSRQVRDGELFFAIPGERFDGHAYVSDAFQRGAAFAVVEAARFTQRPGAAAKRTADAAIDPRFIMVDNTVAALGRLAAYHRPLVAAQVIGVVGSNGKTTTKFMIDHVLAGSRRGRSSPKSFNNAIGVPLTLLSATHADEYLVVEIGTNAPGEVAALSALVKPDAVVLTSIGEEHLEGLGSLDGVAIEESSAFAHICNGGAAIVNIDAPHIRTRLPERGVKIVTYGADAAADLRISDVRYVAPWLQFRVNGRFDYRVQAPGAHNAWNAAGAIAIGRRFGLDHADIAVRLESFKLPSMRMELIEHGGVTFINDAYNANPASVSAALASLATMDTDGRRIAVLGEMRELGAQSDALHRRIGKQLVESGVDYALFVGAAARVYADGVQSAEGDALNWELLADAAEAAHRLGELCRPGDLVLLKASRAVGLEQIIEHLRSRSTKPPAASVA